jgi:hypothetical protein
LELLPEVADEPGLAASEIDLDQYLSLNIWMEV